MDTSEKLECLFVWGDCATRRGTADHVRTHECRQDRNHSRLHACEHCGVVYLARRSTMSVAVQSLPPRPTRFMPKRDDDVARWLKEKWRDNFPDDEFRQLIDDILDDYREHADTGTPLDVDINRGKS